MEDGRREEKKSRRIEIGVLTMADWHDPESDRELYNEGPFSSPLTRPPPRSFCVSPPFLPVAMTPAVVTRVLLIG